MSFFKTKFESHKQEWETPDDLFDRLDQEFHFDIDLAADSRNREVQTVLQQENQRLAPNLARNGLAESTLRSTRTQVVGLGAKGLPGNPQAGMHRGHADSRPHQHSLVA